MKNRDGFALIDLVVVTGIAAGIGAISLAPLMAGGRLSNERAAVASLKGIVNAEADFRANDRDGNRVNDFWTADVFALYGMIPVTGAGTTVPGDSSEATNLLKLLDLPLAAADGRTDQALYGNLEFASSIERGRAKRGFVFRALHNEVTGGVETTLLNDTDGAGQFYGACHDCDRFAFIAFPVSLMAGRSLFVVNVDNTIWSYLLPKGYTATFTGSKGTATDSTSTTGDKNKDSAMARQFMLTAASGQGTFPAVPPSVGCRQIKEEVEPDWDSVLKESPLSLSESIDKGLAEAGEGTVLLAEIELDGKKVVCGMEIAKGKDVIAATLDLKDGKVIARESETYDLSERIKPFKVTAKQAIEAALKTIPGQAVAVELGLHRGMPMIQVRIWSKGRIKVAQVDSVTGSVDEVDRR